MNGKIGKAGTLESNDLMVIVDLSEETDLILNVESIVMDQFGRQIEKVARETLWELGIDKGHVQVSDHGALDFTIRARVKSAVRRAKEVEAI